MYEENTSPHEQYEDLGLGFTAQPIEEEKNLELEEEKKGGEPQQ